MPTTEGRIYECKGSVLPTGKPCGARYEVTNHRVYNSKTTQQRLRGVGLASCESHVAFRDFGDAKPSAAETSIENRYDKMDVELQYWKSVSETILISSRSVSDTQFFSPSLIPLIRNFTTRLYIPIASSENAGRSALHTLMMPPATKSRLAHSPNSASHQTTAPPRWCSSRV